MKARYAALTALLALGCSDDVTATDAAADATDAAVDAVDAAPAPVVRATAPLIRYVDPIIGTGGDGFGTGSAFPGPQRPFGLARPGPDTTNAQGDAVSYAHCAGYAHFDTHISGFSQLHAHGTGIVDYGALGFMPVIGMTPDKTRKRGRLARFTHARETAQPSYYRVAFEESQVLTEVSATDHVALYRVTFPRGADGNVLFDVGHALVDVRVTDGAVEVDRTRDEVHGRVHLEGSYSDRIGGVDAYWVARLSRPIARAGTWLDGTLDATAAAKMGAAVGAYVPIETASDGSVTVAIGMSLTDLDHARANLDAEAADLDFDRVRREGEAQWESLLGRVTASARGDAALRTLYTSVYHTLLIPMLPSYSDGTYRGVYRAVHHAEGFRYYSDLSFWDTFRTEHPWLTLVYPEYQRDFVRSLLAMADVLGYFPRWPLATGETGGMLGDCGALMVADTWLRGLRDYDAAHAWEIARRSAFSTPTRRDSLEEYTRLRYVPVEAGGASASTTLEYAYADGALAAMARGLGHAEDAAALAERATSYRSLWDPAQRFLVGRRRDGTFATSTGPTAWQSFYAEGGVWQYLWYAPHDLAGLAAVMGGSDAMLARLDEMFELTVNAPRTPLPDRYYWQGNEPDIHAPWIPSRFDDAARASRFVDWVRRERYGDGPDGIPGNDDAGTMSAWYVFAALGVFPIAGTDTWLLAAPSVTDATVTLPGGASLHVSAPEAGTGALRPSMIRWADAPLAHPTLTHEVLARGGHLTFDLVR